MKEEEKETEEKINENRKFQIDAMIMKILKEKKSLTHNELMQEIIQRMNFPVETSFTKTRIESLIEKDYIKRNAQNSAAYDYNA